jgi:hypothetical protein
MDALPRPHHKCMGRLRRARRESASERTGKMYQIVLTRGPAWNAPALETYAVRSTMHVADVERLAVALLAEARRKPNRVNPDGYRILDAGGKVVKNIQRE